MELTALITQLATLAGVGALIALIVNIGKTIGLIKDGQAQNYVAGLNLFALIIMTALKVFRPDLDLIALDSTASQIAATGLVVFGLVVQISGSKWAHEALRGVPLVGKSFTQ